MADWDELEDLAEKTYENLTQLGLNEGDKAIVLSRAFQKVDKDKVPSFMEKAMSE